MFQKSFKALMTWRLVADSQRIPEDIDALNDALSKRPAEHPPESMRTRTGFSQPFGNASSPDTFVEPVGKDAWLIAHTSCDRKISTKAYKQAVERHLRDLERETGEAATARDKAQAKEYVLEEMLPQAFVEENTVYVILTPKHLHICVNSARVGETVLDDLRSVLGSLKVIPALANDGPIAAFTHWFKQGSVSHQDNRGDEIPFPQFYLGQRFVIEDPETRSKIRGTWEHLYDDDFVNWVHTTGARVLSIGLNWRDDDVLQSETGVTFILTEMLGIRGIKWPKDLLDGDRAGLGGYSDEELDEITEEERERAAIAADAILFVDLLRVIWKTVTDALGGEQEPEEAHDSAPLVPDMPEDGDDLDDLI